MTFLGDGKFPKDLPNSLQGLVQIGPAVLTGDSEAESGGPRRNGGGTDSLTENTKLQESFAQLHGSAPLIGHDWKDMRHTGLGREAEAMEPFAKVADVLPQSLPMTRLIL